MGRMRLLENAAGTQFEGFCIVRSVSVRQNVKGAEYLDLVLADCDGEGVAKLWDYSRDSHGIYEQDDVIKVRGSINLWKDTEQLKIERIRHTVESDGVDMALLVPCAPLNPEEAFDSLYSEAERFRDDDLRRLVQYMLKEKKEQLLLFPAAVKLHHATRSGLLHHTCTMLQLAKSVCKIYPKLDTDLVYTGVILHDIGKLAELETGKLGLAGAYTAQGQLLGHISIGVSEVLAYAELLGVPQETAMLAAHLLLSHHGQAEFGSPRPPMFPEAEVLSEIDLLDSRLYEMFSALEGVAVGGFSERQWALENRQLYQHGHNASEGE